MGGSVDNGGHIEVRKSCNSNWGTVCHRYWDVRDARVACHQLGYEGDNVTYSTSDRVEPANRTVPILVVNLGCSGTEKNLFECRHYKIGIHSCNHSKDTSILCDTSTYVK